MAVPSTSPHQKPISRCEGYWKELPQFSFSKAGRKIFESLWEKWLKALLWNHTGYPWPFSQQRPTHMHESQSWKRFLNNLLKMLAMYQSKDIYKFSQHIGAEKFFFISFKFYIYKLTWGWFWLSSSVRCSRPPDVHGFRTQFPENLQMQPFKSQMTR